MCVGGARGLGEGAATVADSEPGGGFGAGDGGFAQLGGMGIARHLAAHGAQAKPLGGVVAGVLDPPVIKDQRLGAAAFEEQFAIVSAIGCAAQRLQGGFAVDLRLEGAEGLVGHVEFLCRSDLARCDAGRKAQVLRGGAKKRLFAAMVFLVCRGRIWF